jgi:hypothetical protein
VKTDLISFLNYLYTHGDGESENCTSNRGPEHSSCHGRLIASEGFVHWELKVCFSLAVQLIS